MLEDGQDPAAYAYLLGLFLGDGTVRHTGRTWQLRIWLDSAYPGIVDECGRAMEEVLPGRRAAVRTRPGWNAVAVDAGDKRLERLLPQHGPGRKHERPIVLEPWQQELVDAHPRPFLRGLVHSDGCRTVNRFSTQLPSGRVAEYAYARYFFSNLSADIRGLFCASCDQLGIRWTQSNPRNISVAHRPSVAVLDSFIGPKT